jgi:Tfp pilus assembly protein PilV
VSRRPRTPGGERGFALTFVLVTFLLVAVIGLGALSVVMSDLHGAAANTLAMQAFNVAEGGVNSSPPARPPRPLPTTATAVRPTTWRCRALPGPSAPSVSRCAASTRRVPSRPPVGTIP